MRRLFEVAVLVLATGACLGWSQPPEGRPDRPAESRQPDDRDSYKARLERWLEDGKRRQERIEAAIKKLAEGASVEEVRRETEGPRPPGGFREPRSGRPGPGRPGDDGRGPDPGPSGRLDREEVIALIEANNPDMGAKFRAALKDNPSFAGRMIDRLEPMVREIKFERDAEMRRLRIDNLKNGFELVGATRTFMEANRADPAGQATTDALQHLRTLLGAHFDIQTKMHQQEIVLLERRIAQIREDLGRQLEDRQTFIDRRIEDVRRGFRGRGEPKPGDSRPGDSDGSASDDHQHGRPEGRPKR